MKYGKNQWARISSLIVRKTAKQCKSRWYEWLDPSIKKTEWTREEEEKLLHLAKLLPSQWRTIAPIVGRTAAQCLEHYEKLLDAAQEKEGGAVEPGDDPRRLRPGEIDPHPEAKPARPDPIDMDEDEKEMLSEARARLANTKGKKAKRKAREKQLEEARRLAYLQKKRELKAAGIELRPRKRKRRDGIDYKEEVPFEKKPQVGFFDTAEEKKQTVDILKSRNEFLSSHLQDMEGKRRDMEEDRLRKKDAKKLKLFKETNLPDAMLAVSKLNDPEQIRRRGQMALPSPQVDDKELEAIARLGAASGVLALMAPTGGSEATRTLLSSAGGATPAVGAGGFAGLPTPGRTQRTPMQRDTILQETQNLLALTRAQTPLKGGENTPLHATDFSGITPKRRAMATPSVHSMAMTPGHRGAGGATPARPGSSVRGTAPGATPLRDDLGINELLDGGLSAADALRASSARAEKQRQRSLKNNVRTGLSSLPAPSNEYALVLPDLPSDINGTKAGAGGVEEEDAEDAAARRVQLQREREEAALRARSQVLQRGLPRPVSVNISLPKPDRDDGRRSNEREADELITSEMMNLVRFDHIRHPLPWVKIPRGTKAPKLTPVTEAELTAARELVVDEAKIATESLVASVHSTAWSMAHDDITFLPSRKAPGLLSTASRQEHVTALQQQFELAREAIAEESKRAQKVEQTVGILVGGYQARAKSLNNELQELVFAVQQSSSELACFAALAEQEAAAIPRRVIALKAEVAALQAGEVALQTRFATLTKERDARIAAASLRA